MAIAQSPKARVIVGVDTGGTFTDITLLDPATGRVWNAKTPSTPDDRKTASGVLRLCAKKLSASR